MTAISHTIFVDILTAHKDPNTSTRADVLIVIFLLTVVDVAPAPVANLANLTDCCIYIKNECW